MATEPLLYDATGQLMKLESPPPPSSGRVPTGVSADVSDRWRMYPTRSLTPENIVAILEQADGGDPYELIELEEEIVEKDGKIESILKSRVNAVQGLSWDVVAPKLKDQSLESKADEIARECYAALNATDFSCLIGDLMDAVGKPFAVDWIRWGTDTDGRIVPQGFARIPTKHMRWGMYTNELRIYQPSEPGTFTGGEWGEPIPPYQTVRAIDLSRRDDPARAGVLRTLVWPFFFKMLAIKRMAAYNERFGMPPRVLKIEDSDFDNAERYTKFKAAMQAFGEDLSAVVSKNSELDIRPIASEDGVNVFIGSVDYYDKWMAWKVLGHELTSQSSPGQGQLGITAAMDVRQDIKEGDCRWLSGIIKRDILTPIVGWNWGWDAVNRGLVPELQFDYELPRDLDGESKVLERVQKLYGSNLPVSKSWVRDTYGIPAPVEMDEATEAIEEDDVLEPASAPAPQLPGQQPGVGGPDSQPTAPQEMPDPNEMPMEEEGPVMSQTFAAIPPTDPPQAPIDRLADKGIRKATRITDEWARRLRAMLRQAAADNLTMAEAKQRVVAMYPDLETLDLDRVLKEQLILSRLHGRNGG